MNPNVMIASWQGSGWILLVSAAALLLGSQVRPASGAVITNLRCEYLNNPFGIDQTRPRLSWIIQSAVRGDCQRAYQVLVAATQEALSADQGDLWDSGRVESNQSINVEYAGKPLQSGMLCHWKLRIWDKNGQPSKWSDPAVWTMGLLEQSEWEAHWIELQPRMNDPASALVNLDAAKWIWTGNGDITGKCCLRRVVNIGDRPIQSAVVDIFAEDEFTLWVNGHEAASGIKSLQPTLVDVAKFLQPGRNVLAVSAAIKKARPGCAGLIANFTVHFVDGISATIVTDSSWRAAPFGEKDWINPDFEDTQWANARLTGGLIYGDQTRRWNWDSSVSPARYMRKEFIARHPIQRATAYVCGLGWFELHVNGRKVGDHVLDPMVSDYNRRAFYVTFDVTDFLKQGTNAIGAILGLGRYSNMQLRLQVDLRYEDGSTDRWISDQTWKVTDRGPITSNSEYDGESCDARMEMPGWDQTGFDDSLWPHADTAHAPSVIMSSQMVEPIRIVQTIRPVALSQPKPGVFVFDMGQNMVGWCRLQVSGPAGTSVQLRHAETLQSNGEIYVANLRTAKATDRYTLKGDGTEVYEPRLTYHGFRYVELSGFPGTPDLSTIQGQVVSNDLATSGSFECSNQLLNQIHHNIFWGLRGNYNGVPTDCPQRNERLGWLGDRGGECLGEPYLFNIAALYAKWLDDMRDSQTPSGSISDTAPGNLHNDGVVWPSTYLIAADMLYQRYGNLRCLSDHYDAMKKWIQFTAGFLGGDGTISRNTYGDWCVPPENPSLIHSQDPLRQTDGALLSSAYFYHDLILMSQAAKLLDKQQDAAEFDAQARDLREAFNRRFLDVQKVQYSNGSQTSSILPLAFGMVPPQYQQRIFQNLVDKITQSGDHIGAGLVGAQWLMQVLSENGRPDLAYAIATQTTYPSWGYMISKGATTIWELWNGDTADPAMNSGNHVMLVGDLDIWLQEFILGIAPDPHVPASQHIIIHPHPLGDLKFARGYYDSPYGRISIDWRMQDGFSLKVTIPPNATATIYVPATSPAVTESGTAAALSPGVKFIAMHDNAAVFEVTSGSFDFHSAQ